VSRRAAVVVGAVALLLVALELLAAPLATRAVDRALTRCVAYDELELTRIGRPVLPRLLLGRARDVELRAEGLRVEPLRVEEVTLAVPRVVLPWAAGAGDEPVAGDLRLRILERDLEVAVRELLPVAVPVGVALERDLVRLSAPLLPVALELRVEAEPDGAVRLTPSRGGELLDRLGLAPRLAPTASVRVTEVVVDRGEVSGEVALAEVPGFGGGEGCEERIRLPGASR
jgi:hypothetical protein